MDKKISKRIRFAVLATDVVLFTISDKKLKTLLMPVNRPPHFKNVPGFPGGIIKSSETAEESVRRQLRDKGGIDPKLAYIEQLHTFSEVDRDPRGRVVSVAYLSLIPQAKIVDKDRECQSWWCPVDKVPRRLAYDHDKILKTALRRLRARITYTNMAGYLLPKTFTLTDLQNVYEIVLGRNFDKRNFRKKILSIKLVKSFGKKNAGAHRPAELYAIRGKGIKIIEIFT